MNTNSGKKVKYGGALKAHWQWSVLLSLTLLILDGILLWRYPRAGLIAVIFTAVYYLAVLGIYMYLHPRIMQELVTFATAYGQVQKRLLKDFELPVALLEADGKVLWMNSQMVLLVGKSDTWHKSISNIFPEINRAALPITLAEQNVNTNYGGRDFRAHIQKISITEMIELGSPIESAVGDSSLYMVYLFDETALNALRRDFDEQRCVVALVYLDNYEEAMERTDEVHQSLMNVLVERRISQYFSDMDGLVKKLEKDKYLVVFNNKTLQRLKDDRFSILDGVKAINIGGNISMTISGGIGVGGSYISNYEQARSAIEMALGRGGDQIVIKEDDGLTFYGGKTQRSEKSTRVKARVKAQALRELIMAREEVVVMGHSLPDMDSLGAAVGVCRAAQTVGKKAHIVIGDMNTIIRDWVSLFRDSREYPSDMFISHEQAMELVDGDTALVVVDTNRSSMVECRELLYRAGTIIVLDHHRQTKDPIENAALSYIEPSASSSCEMISEVLQYFEESVELKSLEADCIYAGIVIDTQSFVAKTGVRTFEAAAYLKRSGADVIRVRKGLRDSANSYKAKAEAVGAAETVLDHYAITVCHAEGLEDPNIAGAQAANDLLNISGVKASFVITPVKNRMFISARSIDEVNVQLVMERMGGGGHLSIAGAQLEGTDTEQAKQKIKDVLYQMTEEGAI